MRNILAVLLICFCFGGNVLAAEAQTADEQAAKQEQRALEDRLMQEFDFGEIEGVLREIMPEKKTDFGATLRALLNGDLSLSVKLIEQVISDQIAYEFQHSRKGLIQIFLIAVIAAVFTNFSNVFQNKQIGEISFYVLYLLLITICLGSFRVMLDAAGERLRLLTVFMKALGPAYFLSVAISAGAKTAVAFYNLVLFLIYLAELLILNFLFPLLHIYVVVKILNRLSPEDYMSKLSELLEFLIVWTSKTVLAVVVGLNLIQGLTVPAVDSLKRGILAKGIEAIPVVGDAAGGVGQTLLGTAVLIKNGIGMTGAVFCLAICAVPAVQLLILTFLYKMLAALVQPVSDQRIVGCITDMGDGSLLLLRLVCTTGAFFLITIAVVAATTTF